MISSLSPPYLLLFCLVDWYSDWLARASCLQNTALLCMRSGRKRRDHQIRSDSSSQGWLLTSFVAFIRSLAFILIPLGMLMAPFGGSTPSGTATMCPLARLNCRTPTKVSQAERAVSFHAETLVHTGWITFTGRDASTCTSATENRIARSSKARCTIADEPKSTGCSLESLNLSLSLPGSATDVAAPKRRSEAREYKG